MPPLLNEIVRTVLASESDVEVETRPVPAADIASADAVSRADVLIVAEQRSGHRDYAPMLYAHPRLRLVAISDDRRGAVLYELRPHREELGELSPESLVRAVHARPASQERA